MMLTTSSIPGALKFFSIKYEANANFSVSLTGKIFIPRSGFSP